jgi:phospholipase C
MVHMARLRERFDTHFVPFAEFEQDAAAGVLPDFSLIEPNLLAGHGDYHPAFARALLPGIEVAIDPPSSILAGEAFLARIYAAVRSARSSSGSNVYNTTFFIGWDEPGGTYDHVAPGPVPPPDPAAPAGQLGFRFDRSGYRVPAVIVSPWVAEKSVFTEEYRHTSMIATLRKVWDLGPALSGRDAAARTFEDVFRLEVPRDPESWPEITALPVAEFQMAKVAAGEAFSALGRHLCHGLLHHAQETGMEVAEAPSDPEAELSPAFALDLVSRIASRLFSRLG